jgi:UDP-GlcNAc:undecaprenyl-phosphate GlcNAc-1-phosphate transferase
MWARELTRVLVLLAVPALLLLGSVLGPPAPRDVAWVATVLAILLGGHMLLRRSQQSLLVKLAVYVAAIMSAYLIVNTVSGPQGLHVIVPGLVIALAAAIGGYVTLGSGRQFGTTPTDFLVLFVLFVLLLFGNLDVAARTLMDVIVYAIVLLYGCEVLITLLPVRRFNPLLLSALLTLTIVAIRGVATV